MTLHRNQLESMNEADQEVEFEDRVYCHHAVSNDINIFINIVVIVEVEL